MSLSPSKLKVLALLAAGNSNKEIAHSLGLTEGTVKAYVHQCLLHAHCANRVQLCRWAIANDLHQEAQTL